jgi:uncharacterized protein (TIGR03435 family)
MSQAYDVRIFQIVGLLGWMGTDKYDITTKDEAQGPSESGLKEMNDKQREQIRDRLLGKLRVMLSARFQLKFHRETKEMPVYGLMIAKGGVKMEAAAEGEQRKQGEWKPNGGGQIIFNR